MTHHRDKQFKEVKQGADALNSIEKEIDAYVERFDSEQFVARKWYKLKVYDEYNIAVACFISHHSVKEKISVAVLSEIG